MNDIIKCPSCGRELQIPDSAAGQSVQCPHCQRTFTAQSGSITASEPLPTSGSAAPEPRRRRYDEDDDEERGTLDDIDVRKPSGPMPHNYIVESILVMLCCCQIFGIIALIYGVQVSSYYTQGNYEKAVEASETAKKWCVWGAVIGGIIVVLWVVLQFSVNVRN